MPEVTEDCLFAERVDYHTLPKKHVVEQAKQMSINPNPQGRTLSRLEVAFSLIAVVAALAFLVLASSIFIDVFLGDLSRSAWFYRN